MLSMLKPKVATKTVAPEDVQRVYKRSRMQALLGVFFGYMAYYIVRNNFALSTPHLKTALNLSATEIGLLSSCMLIAYGVSKGVMSSLADKANPKIYMALGLLMCALVNIMLGFSTAFWTFAVLVIFNGFFQAWALVQALSPWPTGSPRRKEGWPARFGMFPTM